MDNAVTEPPVLEQVRGYWEQASCGTTITGKEKYSREYFEEIEEFRYRHEPFIHAFAQFTRWHGKKVLEVGVGAGTDFLQFVRAGAIASGVDLTDEAIRNVGNRLALYGLSADLRRCDATRLPFPDGAFDLAYSWGVIHHSDDMEAVLAEMYRVTRPGGTVKVMVYNRASWYAWYMFLRHGLPRGRLLGGRDWAVYHFQESIATKVYTERELRRMLAAYPHRDLRFEYHHQHLREGARFRGVRRLVHAARPRRASWYLAFQLVKA